MSGESKAVVEAVDREAAANALRAVGRGLFPEHHARMSEAFARHRRATGQSERSLALEEAAETACSIINARYGEGAANQVAAAIRALATPMTELQRAGQEFDAAMPARTEGEG